MIEIDDDVFTFQEDLDMSKENFAVTGYDNAEVVVEALLKASNRFMLVDESGVEHENYDSVASAAEADLYTPNYVSDPEITKRGVELYLDCKGSIEDPMAEKLRAILREELEGAGVAGRVIAVFDTDDE